MGFAFSSSMLLISLVVQIALLITARSMIWLLDQKFFGRKRVLIVGEDITDCL